MMFVALLAGCNSVSRGGNQVAGSGNRKSENRDVPEFNAVLLDGAYKVELTSGKARRVEIEADDNLLPFIATEVENGRLRIHNTQSYNTRSVPHVRISVPDLRELSLSGASNLDLSGVKNDALKISVQGASKLSASGETGALDINLSGASSIDARELRAQRVVAVTNGAGSISVHALDALDATVNGVGTIDYYGDPKTVNPKVNGFGKINKKSPA
jgi:hypothetical protein